MSRGHFYARLEETDWRFIRQTAKAHTFDAALVKASYIAPYPAGDSRHGQKPDRLIKAIRERGFQWALDPATAAFGHHMAAEWTSPRARSCPLATVMSLPWEPALLLKRGDPPLELLSRADSLQRRSRAFAVPYFEAGLPDDTRLRANCTLIDMGRELAGDRRVVAYLQTLRSRLRDGSAAEAARQLIVAGAQTIAIRIRGLDSSALEDVIAYLDLVRLIEREGARPLADCVGYLGPTLIAGGADAFTAGARYFKGVPKSLLTKWQGSEKKNGAEDEERRGGSPIFYQVPGSYAAVHCKEIEASFPSCAIDGCNAFAEDASPPERREHNLHDFKQLGRDAAAAGYGYADVLRALPGELPQIWAAALDQQAAQRRAL